MAGVSLPFVSASGNVTKVLEKIRTAQVPPRFSQDFLSTKLAMTGGSARPVVPFLKRTGFLASDGTPTDLYRRFRNDSQSGAAAAEALRIGYAPLFEVNEYVHEATDPALKGLVVQLTGAEPDSSTVTAILGSFKALKAFADFDAAADEPSTPAVEPTEPAREPAPREPAPPQAPGAGINLGYTINLYLPATSDIAVFDSIFKSLREHLM
jgi:hypothetical protein